MEELEREVEKLYDRYLAAVKSSGEAAPVGFAKESQRMAAWNEYRRKRDELYARQREAGTYSGPTPIKLRRKYQ